MLEQFPKGLLEAHEAWSILRMWSDTEVCCSTMFVPLFSPELKEVQSAG